MVKNPTRKHWAPEDRVDLNKMTFIQRTRVIGVAKVSQKSKEFGIRLFAPPENIGGHFRGSGKDSDS